MEKEKGRDKVIDLKLQADGSYAPEGSCTDSYQGPKGQKRRIRMEPKKPTFLDHIAVGLELADEVMDRVDRISKLLEKGRR